MGNYLNPGNSGFAGIRNDINVDKSGLIGLINETIDTPRRLTCVSRPRRFGKSFAAQMLCAYYDKTCDSTRLFEGLEIAGDAPIREAKNRPDLQKKYLEFLRSLFKNSRMTSKIFAAVYMTGILPIKKDGFQFAISDFQEYSMLKPRQFAEYVGFTEEEVRRLCRNYGCDFEKMKRWYDGYFFPKSGSCL